MDNAVLKFLNRIYLRPLSNYDQAEGGKEYKELYVQIYELFSGE